MKYKVKKFFKKNKVEGVRQGQELDALLGHQTERGLHDPSKRKKGKIKRN